MKFSNIRLLVADFDTCFSFYKETLGLECTWGKPGDNFASFTIGIPSGLSLFSADLMKVAINHKEAAEAITVQDKMAIVIQVDNVDETFETLKTKGVNFITEPKNMAAWGIRVAHFRDPENNLIELFQDLPKD